MIGIVRNFRSKRLTVGRIVEIGSSSGRELKMTKLRKAKRKGE